MMTTLDWVVVVAVWLLIPAVLALKVWRDRVDAKTRGTEMKR